MSSKLWSFFNPQIFATPLVLELDARQKSVISSSKFNIWNFIKFVGMERKREQLYGRDDSKITRGRNMGKGIPFFLLLETDIHE
jgi:hypothetical protein